MALTMNEDHARLLVLHGASGDLVLLRKVISAKVLQLGISPEAFEPFADAETDSHSHDLNLRSYLDWVDSISHPTAGDEKGERAMKEANIALLGRLAATLAKRYREPAAEVKPAVVVGGAEPAAEVVHAAAVVSEPVSEPAAELTDLPPDAEGADAAEIEGDAAGTGDASADTTEDADAAD